MDAVSLSIVAEEELEHAGGASSCRSARTIHGGRDRVLRETVIALLAGHDLAEHESPGEATVQVLHGHVRLVSAGEAVDGIVGDHLIVPPDRHALAAVVDSVVLLTVAKPAW